MAKKANPSAPLGSGGRFKAVQQSIEKEGKSPAAAAAIAAAVGRKAHGSKQMAKWAAEGKAKKK